MPPRSAVRSLSELAPEPARISDARTILVSLNQRERDSFLPQDDLEKQLDLPGTFHLVDSSATTTESLAEEIEIHRPEIIIASWSTPTLPVPNDGSLPVPYLCYLSGSVKNCVPRELIVRGLKVSNWGQSISRYVAECAMTLSLASLRNLGLHQHAMRENWPWRFDHTPEGSLFGRKVGLHGFGSIAREFLHLLQPYNTTCMAWDPFVDAEEMRTRQVEPAESLEALYRSSDLLVVFCALTEQTRGIIDTDLLQQLPVNAVFINVARGELVDENALIDQLQKGRIRAGLDVFREEPLPRDSELRKLTNVVLTPHLGGFTSDSRAYALQHGIQNLRHYAREKTPRHLITLDQFDRMT
ncbi:MAG: hydroxyacid dehydrogenase [Puniceicoccales bacterium]